MNKSYTTTLTILNKYIIICMQIRYVFEKYGLKGVHGKFMFTLGRLNGFIKTYMHLFVLFI